MGGREEEERPRFLYTFLGAGHPIGRPYKLNFEGRHTPSAAPENGEHFQGRVVRWAATEKLICRGGSSYHSPMKMLVIFRGSQGGEPPL